MTCFFERMASKTSVHSNALLPHLQYVTERHEGKLPASGFWWEIYTVSAAGNLVSFELEILA